MFRAIRRIKNARPAEEAKRLLRECRRAALAVAGDDGYPYAVPVNFWYEEADMHEGATYEDTGSNDDANGVANLGRIYIHGSKRGHKIDSIRAHDKVCLTVWETGTRDAGDWAYRVSSCVVFGRARLIEDAQIAEEKLRSFALKYYPSAEEVEDEIRRDFRGVQMIEIRIEHMSAKRVHEK